VGCNDAAFFEGFEATIENPVNEFSAVRLSERHF
jgi:hypothetical protein